MQARDEAVPTFCMLHDRAPDGSFLSVPCLYSSPLAWVGDQNVGWGLGLGTEGREEMCAYGRGRGDGGLDLQLNTPQDCCTATERPGKQKPLRDSACKSRKKRDSCGP